MKTDRIRASISATVAEIEQGHRNLGIGCDEAERAEVMAIIGRIERALVSNGIEGDKKWTARKTAQAGAG